MTPNFKKIAQNVKKTSVENETNFWKSSKTNAEKFTDKIDSQKTSLKLEEKKWKILNKELSWKTGKCFRDDS